MFHLSHLLLILSSISFRLAAGASQYCKPIPGSPRWPPVGDWNALNDTVQGRLIAPTPPGAVCKPDSPTYNNDSCAALSSGPALWAASDWHAKDPVSVDYNDDTCLPNALAPCSGNGYPEYVVNATEASHVQAAVRFAERTGVRLIIKATGHDFPMRSSGGNSLSIWTHYMYGIETIRDDPRAVAYGAVAAVKIRAGMRVKGILEAMAKEKLTVMAGAEPHVGIIGWTTGAGHGPLTSVYGLGADQVLEMEVVTADGEYRVVNETSYPELFWAIRGGGPSTFGVILSVTVKAYPATYISEVAFAYNTTGDSDTFWTLAAYFHQQIPALSEAGIMGYYFVLPELDDPTAVNASQKGKIAGGWIFPNKTAEQSVAILKPMEDHIRSASWGDLISITSIPTTNNTEFNSKWVTGVGIDARLGSWLLGKEGLSQDLDTLKTQLRKAASPSPNQLLGHVIAGPGVARTNQIPGCSNAVLPAWRDAYTHLVAPRGWPYLNTTAKQQVTADLRDVRVPALKALQPDSGAYMNEADPTNPEWKKDYFGSNYKELLKVKRKWDPRGVFWCKPCVGHDLWEIKNWSADGEGVGQDVEMLCRR